jgi:hypothetical protein
MQLLQKVLCSLLQFSGFLHAERYEEIKEDFVNLLSLGLEIASITCNGDKATLKAIKNVVPRAVVQRRIVYIQRMRLLCGLQLIQPRMQVKN